MPYIRLLQGTDGAQELSPEATRVARTPATYSARLAGVTIGRVELQHLKTDAYSAHRTLARLAFHPVDLVQVILIVAGAMRARQDGRTGLSPAGSITVLRTSATYDYALSDKSEILQLTVPSALLPVAALRNLRSVTAVALNRPLLVETTLAFVKPRLDASANSETPATEVYESMLLSLVNSCIVGAAADDSTPSKVSNQLFDSAMLIVRDRIRSPDLSVETVARELGVSVRNVYRVFNGQKLSITDHIRTTRLTLIAARLDAPGGNRSFEKLALEYGFGSFDVAARAFKSHFAMTMSAYVARARTGVMDAR
ncbi:AraC-like ligand-binding domain-containing protein [Subtercola frigoramans]|uniref:AraC family transcriptional activator of tynA and feaB n=1 Tax=Subtercola frigoramans TaxID=120298 RepID=A0ABS2L8H1_9MICO|nr:helix-turn-helix domain-containing protein [Subtercola frigoramans]MBM7473388.1 AraC family transcriptional activator of tynA and feaB [Subtercola frigoramans]